MSDRKLQFTGVLFDGKTADKHPVEILLTPRDLVLRRQGDPASGSWSWP
ncbi:MAG: hypothetical protein GWM98_04465, partial [Nitrospinaceae bacterium]|nr:hypothetical protein [Nitrospinaceae bacterium]NIR53896.1 hypothetical protein [Nitrospinaceae bacterium]NIS84310.1 hypothetical protein [Nitrospinaceae bacterium]NIT81117.1 hypothetical protein [Nitrospinaceae bacterium]NIU43399.1 hypothetical protein [Nitrospinaceae bacterium]